MPVILFAVPLALFGIRCLMKGTQRAVRRKNERKAMRSAVRREKERVRREKEREVKKEKEREAKKERDERKAIRSAVQTAVRREKEREAKEKKQREAKKEREAQKEKEREAKKERKREAAERAAAQTAVRIEREAEKEREATQTAAMRFGLALVFPYEQLKKATDDFRSRVLGGGGFGRVYLGIAYSLPVLISFRPRILVSEFPHFVLYQKLCSLKGELWGGRLVAAKKLYDDSPKLQEQFFNEVAVLSRLHHQNLVALYGCTDARSPELLLVYEFVPNGTVADHLHGQRPTLAWDVRILIAIQTAEALAYLHSMEPPIVHRDVKTSNILLQNDFGVKVADFGLCRLLPWDNTHASTLPQGTVGYRDPEYDKCLRLTDRSDVYSFGVVLMELISGKEAVDVNRDLSEIYLTDMALNKFLNNELEHLSTLNSAITQILRLGRWSIPRPNLPTVV